MSLLPRATSAAGIPQVTLVAPPSFVENGQPIHVTLSGSGFLGVTDVALAPGVSQRQFTIISDSALVITLPAATPVGTYSIRLVSQYGTSIPGAADVTLLANPPAVAVGGPTLPPYSFAPAVNEEPVAVVTTPTAAAAAHLGGTTSVLVRQETTNTPFSNPLFILVFGVFVGGSTFILWGAPGRVAVARRHGLLAQAVARPVQRFHLGRICLHCGRLHWILATRRDLWKAGQFCSATCFVGAQELEATVHHSDTMAPSRMREVTVYADLENQLDLVFAAEAASASTPEALFGDPHTIAHDGNGSLPSEAGTGTDVPDVVMHTTSWTPPVVSGSADSASGPHPGDAVATTVGGDGDRPPPESTPEAPAPAGPEHLLTSALIGAPNVNAAARLAAQAEAADGSPESLTA